MPSSLMSHPFAQSPIHNTTNIRRSPSHHSLSYRIQWCLPDFSDHLLHRPFILLFQRVPSTSVYASKKLRSHPLSLPDADPTSGLRFHLRHTQKLLSNFNHLDSITPASSCPSTPQSTNSKTATLVLETFENEFDYCYEEKTTSILVFLYTKLQLMIIEGRVTTDFGLNRKQLFWEISTWISFVRKNSNKGHFRKAVAVWGCLGNLLLSLIRKWLQVHRIGLIIFLYQDVGLLRDLPNRNCRGQFRYFGTWQLFFCIGTWQLMGLMLKWLFMEESITDLTRKRFILLICHVDWDHSCKEIVLFPYNFLYRFGPNLDNFKRIKRKRFSKDDKKRDIKIQRNDIIDKIFNCKGCWDLSCNKFCLVIFSL
ncbi:hypothetical protein LXL04_007398 [Taraxacum kok-saghyz]